jgi:hypothetical protein
MGHRCSLGESPGTAGLRLEVRHEADVDGGAPEAGHSAMINLGHPALCPNDIT